MPGLIKSINLEEIRDLIHQKLLIINRSPGVSWEKRKKNGTDQFFLFPQNSGGFRETPWSLRSVMEGFLDTVQSLGCDAEGFRDTVQSSRSVAEASRETRQSLRSIAKGIRETV
jgi:hypothetical protein